MDDHAHSQPAEGAAMNGCGHQRDPAHWHRRAEETRKLAERQQTDAGRKAMLRVAILYEEFARRASAGCGGCAMTEPDDDLDVSYRHLEALCGGNISWRLYLKGTKVLGVEWDALPVQFRVAWWEATDYGLHAPPHEFMAWAPQLLAIKTRKRDEVRRLEDRRMTESDPEPDTWRVTAIS
jgi:hypothetical protein